MAALHVASFPLVQVQRGSENRDDVLYGGEIRDLVRDSSLSQLDLSEASDSSKPSWVSGLPVQSPTFLCSLLVFSA